MLRPTGTCMPCQKISFIRIESKNQSNRNRPSFLRLSLDRPSASACLNSEISTRLTPATQPHATCRFFPFMLNMGLPQCSAFFAPSFFAALRRRRHVMCWECSIIYYECSIIIRPHTKQLSNNMTTTKSLPCLLLLVVAVSGFQPSHNLVRPTGASIIRRTGPHHTQLNEKGGPEFEVGGEEYSGDIDWDGEWAKVVKESDSKNDRPGKDFYKSDAERATIKAVNKAAEQVAKVKVQTPSFKPPPFSSLQGDWRFWIGILALLSVGSSLLAASGQSATYTNDSFYI